MRRVVATMMFALASAAAAVAAADPSPVPPWAFVVDNPSPQPAGDDGTPKRLPDSAKEFTRTQLRDLLNAVDWYPGDHPAMPAAVAHGRPPTAYACGFCHLPNGFGRPENASLAGLPAAYIVQQMSDFRSGLRRSSEPRLRPIVRMTETAVGATDAEVQAAAEYFSALQPKPWIRVVETADVPQTRVRGWMLVPLENRGREPIGQRIIETPEDPARTELRDTRSGFVAYAPVGSIARGEDLVTTGGAGKTVQCGICHGPDLKGLGPVPPLAGRSPSYVVRQLYDMQSGARAGSWSALMKPVVARLSEEDMVAIAAYTASRTP